jgi:hypothetical protein
MRRSVFGLLLAGLSAPACGIENDLKVGDIRLYTTEESNTNTGATMYRFEGTSRVSVVESLTRDDTLMYRLETVDSGLYEDKSRGISRDTLMTRVDTVKWFGSRFSRIALPYGYGIERQPPVFHDDVFGLQSTIMRCTIRYAGDALEMSVYGSSTQSIRWIPDWGVLSQDIGYGASMNFSQRSMKLVSRNGRDFEWSRFSVLDTIGVTAIAIARPHIPSRIRLRNPGREAHTLDGRAVPESRRYPAMGPAPLRMAF